MNEAGRGNLNGLDARAAALVAHYERAGYARVEPAILQPAEPFLDLSGEDIRRRMYLTAEPSGRELCLRPDLTIPVSRDYLASEKAGEPAGFCYLGPASNPSAGATPRPPTPRCSRAASRRPRITAWSIPRSAWATSAFSRR